MVLSKIYVTIYLQYVLDNVETAANVAMSCILPDDGKKIQEEDQIRLGV